MLHDARWIIKNQRGKLDAPAPYIRKTFTADKPVNKAVLSICALGFGVCYINGKAVTSDVLTTPMSCYDRQVYYNTYDVTELMSEGKNAIGIVLGNGIYNDANEHWGLATASWRNIPRVILELVITYTDGTKKNVRSDNSFKATNSPTVYNNARVGEEYDARLEIDGWTLPDFDDSAWEKAVIKSGPGGILKPNIIPPIRRIRNIRAVHLGNNVYDLGENISGWVRFKVRGNEGDTVRVVYAERLNPDGSINNDNENELTQEDRIHADLYTLCGGKDEEWEPSFTYHGFRYFTLETDAVLIEASGIVVHTDLQKVGDFECSDEMLNKIHRASVQSTLTCYHSFPEDCPQREQNGWTGDAVISAEQAILNFHMNEAYKQWISDFAAMQKQSGQLPCICPHPNSGYWTDSWEVGPSWDCALMLIPYYVYKYTGDKSLIEDNYDAFVRHLDYLDSIRDGYTITVGLGDWNPPSRKRIFHPITNTCYYHTVAVTVAECAKILGRNPAPYLDLAANIRKDYHEKFINSTIPDMNTQTALACGIYHGMYESDEIPQVIERLVKLIEDNDYHIDCGCLGTKAMFTVLSEWGHADLMLKMVKNPTAPSYAYWIANGMTTLCERWYMDASHNHHYFSEVDHWFYKYIAGIRLSPDGIEIQPCFIDGITWVRAHHRDISVCYDKEKLVIEVPNPAILILDGKKIALAPGKNEVSRK